jgi:manganese/zinc/iron transport system permease protein
VNPGNASHWWSFFTLPTANVGYVLLGCVLLGASAGAIGCFAFLRKQSLLGDALAHAALPGVCMAFMLTATKNGLVILIGALISCWLGAIAVEVLVRHTRCKQDSALGMVLSVFYGIGVLLLTSIQKSGAAAQSGLDAYLYGQAASIVKTDVMIIAAVAILNLLLVAVAYKEFKLVTFDPDFAGSIGLPTRVLQVLMATLIVLAVVIGLQAVGVVLMAALLVTPAAAARYWTDRLSLMIALGAMFGATGGALGAYASYQATGMPTGAWTVMGVTALFVVSLLAAPRRGIIARATRLLKHRRKTATENVLRTLYRMGEPVQRWDDSYTLADLIQHRNMSPVLLRRTLARLKNEGLVRESRQTTFALTEEGIARGARITRLHRLWELYLTRKLELAPDHVHDDAEEIEHILTPDLEARLAAVLDHPSEDPHNQQIPGAIQEGS